MVAQDGHHKGEGGVLGGHELAVVEAGVLKAINGDGIHDNSQRERPAERIGVFDL